MRRSALFSLLAGLTLLILSWAPVQADGIVIPDPGPCGERACPPPMMQLAIRYHHVTVRIEDQVAVTHVDQVFFNPNDWTIEGTYLFPLPADAVVTNFILWIDGKAVQGQVLDAKQALETYTSIVQSMRDPALLEYAGRGAVQARVFPIPPKGERRIELEYTQALTAQNGLVQYVYPLNTEKFSALPLENVSVTVTIDSRQPMRAVYSPSHRVDIARDGDRRVTVSYEESNVTPSTDFSLFYSTGESEAFHLMTYRDPLDTQDKDGFFLLLLAPRPQADARAVAKDVILVLDRSGSMDGEKFLQAQAALRYVLNRLNPDDRFGLIAFSTGVDLYAGGLLPASESAEALRWVDGLSAAGSTDINRALLEAAALTDAERPAYLIFLTDGLPTVGEVNSANILSNFAGAARKNLRLFSFGVGYDVDTTLLDTLSLENHGLSFYVQPGQALDETLSAFYERISTPVLTNVQLDFGSMPVYDMYPNPLPDLFAGGQVVVVGRYRDGGVSDVALKGEVNGEAQILRFPEQVFRSDNRGVSAPMQALPRLWATRKIGFLLNQVRLKGADPETIDQIVRLSIRYGIVTPYTSYLVTEDMPLGAETQRELAEQTYQQMQAMPTMAPSGQNAVEKAADQGAMQQAEAAPAVPAEAAQSVRLAGSRTLVLQNGVWMDTAFDPQRMTPIKVPFLSDDYFKLLETWPDLSPALAAGARVIVVAEGTAYEIVADDAPAEPLNLPTPVVSGPTQTPGGDVLQNVTRTPEPPVPPAPQSPAMGWLVWGIVLGGLALLGIAGGVAALRRKR